jgi:hypothetical protein
MDRLARATMAFTSRFFNTDDSPVEGPARELVGYGENPQRVRWENDAKVAVQIVVNYEEGSEKTFAMGDGENARYLVPKGFGSPEHFFEMAKAHLDRLRNDGDDVQRLMSVGLHPRATGNPARADALARFIEYAQSLGDVWFARRIDIANTFIAQEPSEKWVGLTR